VGRVDLSEAMVGVGGLTKSERLRRYPHPAHHSLMLMMCHPPRKGEG